MNYFQARKAQSVFEEFKRLSTEYWNAQDNAEAQQSEQYREAIAHLLYTANTYATALNAGVTAQQLPPPIIGGPALPVNFLRAAIEPDQGYAQIPRSRVIDALNGCIGAARHYRQKALGRLLNPLCWLVDVPTVIVSWPFLIMRRAGVTPSIEENIVSQIIKVVMVIAICAVVTWFGLSVTLGDILKLWK